MTAQNTMTIGAFLNQAETMLTRTGGFSAIVNCDQEIVRLMHQSGDTAAHCIAEAPLPTGVAGEDVASDLLTRCAAEADPGQIAFARDVYFPILFQ